MLRKIPAKDDLAQWLDVLENRHSVEVHLGLKRVSEVAQKLKLLTPCAKVITIAGTNGKGSTVAALENIYRTAGYKVGAYTSPHLLQFNERIRINLKPIADKALCSIFALIESARGSIMLSFFEVATLAALCYFDQQQVDVILLEVGLGGRLDATNIINTDLAVITTIDYDHQQYLGNTLEAIGFEKAGILREKKPLVYAADNPPESILQQAQLKQVPYYQFEKDYFFEEQQECWTYHGLERTLKQIPKPTIQLQSAAAAISACTLLHHHLPVLDEHIKSAMTKVFVAGRLQLHSGPVSILYDVAHNRQSVLLLAKSLRKIAVKGKVHAVFSALKDKDLLGLILPLKDCVDRWYPAQLDYKRAATSEQILSILNQAEIFADFCYNNAQAAFEAAEEQADDGDLILVYGSFFTVSHVMSAQLTTLEQQEVL